MSAFHLSRGEHAHDVIALQRPFVDPRGGDPDAAVVVADRQIPAGRGRHAIAIDAFHRRQQLVAGMQQI